ncbi:MAG TPA: EAL domain-containing protein, partial [Acidimicrobiales bacterium]|nr:EAL domain-containing protein [Acidimicrobiales bacterium]
VEAFCVITCIAFVFSAAAQLLVRRGDGVVLLTIPIAADIAGLGAVSYAAGLGPMLTGFGGLLMLIDPRGRHGTRTLRPILACVLVGLVAGQLVMQFGDVPAKLPKADLNWAALAIAWSAAMVEETFRLAHRRAEGLQGTLELSEAHHRTLIEHGSEIVMVLDENRVPTYVAPSHARVFGMTAEERIALGVPVTVHRDDEEMLRAAWADLLRAPGASVEMEVRVVDQHRQWHWLTAMLTNRFEDPAVRGVVVNAHDVTAHKIAAEALDRATLYDPITGLPNRRQLASRLGELLARPRRSIGRLAAMFISIDDFELHARAHGSAAMDDLVITVGKRLERFAGTDGIVARVGPQGFVLIGEVSHDDTLPLPSASIAAGDRVARMLAEPVILEGAETYVTASIGVTWIKPGERDTERVVSDAELAMRSARSDGGDRVAVFGAADEQRAVSRVKLAGSLRRALEDGDLRVHFQPIVRLANGMVEGAEALLRWENPADGPHPPEQFIPVAEASGLIVSLGTWVIEQACSVVAGAAATSDNRFSIAVNISGRQLDDNELDATIERVLVDSLLEPEMLTLEVTESALPSDVHAAIQRLAPLRRLGVRIAIDDFGTGYSSLGYLKQLRPDVIKIDRSFIGGLLTDSGDLAIVTAVVNLGKAVGIDVLAEGVEDERQAVALREIGCDLGQGYFFGRPAAADASTFELLMTQVRLPPPAADRSLGVPTLRAIR